jgi:general secretion pathway protein M
MTLSLPPLASRALAVLLLIAIVMGAYFLVVDPLISAYEVNSDAVTQLSAALERYRAAGQQLPQRQAALQALRTADSAREGFLQGANDNLVAATMQSRIKSEAEAARGELRSTQILPAVDEGKLHRIAIRAQMTVTLEAAQKVFYGIEASAPYLFLDNVVMNARASIRRGGQEPDDNPLIDVQFDVYGYTRSAAK